MIELGAVLLVLYVLEGIRWVRLGTAAFSRRPIGGYSVRRPVPLRAGARSGFLLPDPWLPAGVRVLVEPPRPDPAPAGTDHGAAARSLDVREVRRRMRRLRRALRSVSWLPSLLAGNLFLTGPVLGRLLGSARVWPVWLVVHLLLAGAAAVAFVRITRRPGLTSDRRVETAVALVLYPPAAARFVEKISENVLAGLDPLAAAAALAGPGRFERMCWERLAEIASAGGDGEARDRNRRAFLRELEAMLRREGLPVEAILAAPPREAGSQAYCPSCRTQYRTGVERCADCLDVPLVRYETAAGV